jgi:hypothetical protein
MKEAHFTIPPDVRRHMMDPSQESVTFRYADPIHALISMLHFNPLAENWDNLCFTYEPGPVLDDFCNGDRVRRIQVGNHFLCRAPFLYCCHVQCLTLFFSCQETLPLGTAQLNAVMYFDGIQQDETGFVSVDGGIVQGAFFRREAREQNEAMRSVCSFIEVQIMHAFSL